MHLHGLNILHGCISPVSKMEKGVASHIDSLYAQGNILVTRDGQACLGDFGITGGLKDLVYHDHKLETLRYMAPECLSNPPTIDGPSKVGDVYSLAMTSFEVRSFVVDSTTT